MPSGVCVCVLGDRQKQKEAWLHHCLHHGDNLHIYHLAISSLFPSLSCHYSSLITTFTQLRHAETTARDKSRGVCVSNNGWIKRKSSGVRVCLRLVHSYNPCSSPAHTHALSGFPQAWVHTCCAQKTHLSMSAWVQTNKPEKQNSYCEDQQELVESGSRHQKKCCTL